MYTSDYRPILTALAAAAFGGLGGFLAAREYQRYEEERIVNDAMNQAFAVPPAPPAGGGLFGPGPEWSRPTESDFDDLFIDVICETCGHEFQVEDNPFYDSHVECPNCGNLTDSHS